MTEEKIQQTINQMKGTVQGEAVSIMLERAIDEVKDDVIMRGNSTEELIAARASIKFLTTIKERLEKGETFSGKDAYEMFSKQFRS